MEQHSTFPLGGPVTEATIHYGQEQSNEVPALTGTSEGAAGTHAELWDTRSSPNEGTRSEEDVSQSHFHPARTKRRRSRRKSRETAGPGKPVSTRKSMRGQKSYDLATQVSSLASV